MTLILDGGSAASLCVARIVAMAWALRTATQFAREQGAAVLDGHPVDVARLSRRPSPAAVFTGTMSMFIAVGFDEIGRTYPSRPVMRHNLANVD